jgi:hypothetical protein
VGVAMRITKFPPIAGIGLDPHTVKPGSLPPVPPAPPNPAPLPMYPWIVAITNHAPALIFGKFTVTHSVTEGLGDILAGHDWGIMQPHIPTPPVVTPQMPIVTMGSSHKYYLPSYAVQETPQGGALALAGATGSAVAITLPSFQISLQDCIESFVAPTGIGYQVPSTRWVGFGLSDIIAAAVSMAGDGLGAAASGAIGNVLSAGMSDMAGAVLGAVLNCANTALQNRANANTAADAGSTATSTLGIAATLVFAPAAIGLAIGRLADADGGVGRNMSAPDAHGTQIDPSQTGT